MLTPWGQFGPNETVVGDRPLLLGFGVRLGLSVLGCIGGAALLIRMVRRVRAGAWKEMLTIVTAVHLPLLLMPYVIFDRYFIVFMPGALYLAANPATAASPAPTRRVPARRAIGLTVLAAYGLFSVALLHDWLAWNSARWTVGRRALARGIEARDIEGGFEWNGWYSPYAVFEHCRQERRGWTLWLTYCMYAHISGRYALSFAVPEGARAVDQEPYAMWLIPGERAFYLIEPRPSGDRPP
jgi:hypothetical protein